MPNKPKQNILILPQGRSSESFVTTLAHPRNSTPTRYLVDPTSCLYEFTRISPPKATYRSWLVLEDKLDLSSLGDPSTESNSDQVDGCNAKDEEQTASIISKPDLLVATPIDPLFFLLATLHGLAQDAQEGKGLFLSADDILDKACDGSSRLRKVIENVSMKDIFEQRLRAACDTVEAGEEMMYRLNKTKFLQELVAKAGNIEKSNIPKSMENKFIKGALDLPETFVTREDSSLSTQGSSQQGTPSEGGTSLESQSSIAESDAASFADSTATGVTTPDTTEMLPLHSQSPQEPSLTYLLRIRTLLKFILSSYITARLAADLQELLSSDKSPIDFKRLDDRLELVSKMRAEALAARSSSDFKRKRNAFEDDELAEERAEKKRKKEDEEKRKKLESRGIKNLKKADTTGMKKLSSFFGKKVPAKS